MVDPTLEALLSDPSPEARLIASDWLKERGRELDALVLLARPPLFPRWTLSIRGEHASLDNFGYKGPTIYIFSEAFMRGRSGSRWRRRVLTGVWETYAFAAIPSPEEWFIQEVVLSLRQRVERYKSSLHQEVQHGV